MVVPLGALLDAAKMDTCNTPSRVFFNCEGKLLQGDNGRPGPGYAPEIPLRAGERAAVS